MRKSQKCQVLYPSNLHWHFSTIILTRVLTESIFNESQMGGEGGGWGVWGVWVCVRVRVMETDAPSPHTTASDSLPTHTHRRGTKEGASALGRPGAKRQLDNNLKD